MTEHELCEAPHPSNRFGCKLPKGHTGMHQNFGALPEKDWVQGSKHGVRWRRSKQKTTLEYVTERLDTMHKAPLMWASTDEAFAAQVMVLVEVCRNYNDLPALDMAKILRHIIGGEGNSFVPQPLTEEWARFCIDCMRKHLE